MSDFVTKRISPKTDPCRVREALRNSMINNFMQDKKGKRQAIVEFRRRHLKQEQDGTDPNSGCNLIKEFLQTHCDKVSIEDFLNWDDFMDSHDYETLFLDIEQSILTEEKREYGEEEFESGTMAVDGANDEELLDAHGVLDEIKYWDEEYSNEAMTDDNTADVIICPICW